MMGLWIVFVLGLATASVSDKLLVSSQSPVPSSQSPVHSSLSPVPSSQADDLYLEGHPSGDLPVDDEGDDDDIASGSGDFSGDFFHHDVTLTDEKVLFDILEVTPARPAVTQSTPPTPPTTVEQDRRDPPTTAEDSVTSSDVFPEKEEDSEVPLEAGEPTADWSDSAATTGPTSASPPPPPTETVPSREAGGEGRVLTKKEDGVQLEGGAGGRMLDLDTPEEGVTSESLWERTEVLAAIIACGVVAFLCALCLFLLLAYRMKKKDEGSYDLGVTKVPPTAYQKAPTKEFYA